MKELFILAGLVGAYYIYRSYSPAAANTIAPGPASGDLVNSPTLVPATGITPFNTDGPSTAGSAVYPINYQATGPITDTTSTTNLTPLDAPRSAPADDSTIIDPGFLLGINGLRGML
jgi:hypothetical protein